MTEEQQTTAVATVEQSTFLALRPENPLIEAREANGEDISLSSLVWVKTPSGGSTTWSYDDMGNEVQTKSIEGALVVYQKRGILWPTDGEAVEGTAPLLVSSDMRTARKVGDDYGDLDPEIIEQAAIGDGLYDITPPEKGGSFFYSKFGSGRNGGRRLKEQRVMGILPADEAFPLMVTIQPGSLKGITAVMSRLRFPHWRVIVSLTLEEAKNAAGQKYSRAKIAVKPQPLTEDEGAIMKRLYTDPLTEALQSGSIEVQE